MLGPYEGAVDQLARIIRNILFAWNKQRIESSPEHAAWLQQCAEERREREEHQAWLAEHGYRDDRDAQMKVDHRAMRMEHELDAAEKNAEREHEAAWGRRECANEVTL